MSYAEFQASPLVEPTVYAEVGEGCFQIGGPDDSYRHLVTENLLTCKAIALYNPDSGNGLLAHLDGTTKVPRVLGTILEAYPDDVSSADVSIIEASQDDDTYLWPTSDRIANFFMNHNPRSLKIDRNDDQLPVRGIALDLKSGCIHSIGKNDSNLQRSRRILKTSSPLRIASSWY